MKPYATSHLTRFRTIRSEYFENITLQHEIHDFMDSVHSSPGCSMVNGPTGVGKSHLVNWICLQISARHPDLKIGVTTGDVFAIENADSFNLIVLDGVDILVRDCERSVAIANLIAKCKQSQIGLIIACEHRPEIGSGASEALLSSLSLALTTHLGYPDYDSKVCIAKAIGESLNISDPINYDQVTDLSSIREIESFLTRVKILNELDQSASLV